MSRISLFLTFLDKALKKDYYMSMIKKYKKVYIEITNVCNFSCSFCAKTHRIKQFMSVEAFERIIKMVNPYTEYIYLHVMGEPLLHDNLKEILDVAERYNKRVIITTNATKLSQKYDTLFNHNAIFKIVMSVHSFEANDSTISFDEYINCIINFSKDISQKTDKYAVLRLWNYGLGKHEMNDMILNKISREFSVDIDINHKKDTLLSRGVYLQTADKFDWPDVSRDKITDKVFCYGLRDHFGILVDGTVVPCCLDSEGQIALGNCFSESLSDILQSERAIRMYDGFSQRKATERLCERCGYATRFKMR